MEISRSSHNPDPLRIGVVGDVHLLWSDADTRWFNRSDLDYVLFVGDFATYRQEGGLGVARSISQLNVPAFVIPGNHDGPNLAQLIAEVAGVPRLERLAAGGQRRRCEELARALGPVRLVGYCSHRLSSTLSLIVARPHAMGGPRLSFARYLGEVFGIHSLEDSSTRLCDLIDRCDTRDIVFLGHNGPTGLGDRRHDIWGCDFKKTEGDFGDPDLRVAIDYAKRAGKRVRAVVAGHMHHALKGGGERVTLIRENDTTYVNAARVPRVFRQDGEVLRHHVRLEITADEVRATTELISTHGDRRFSATAN